MEYFLCVSFIGTFVLLAVHAVDFAFDFNRWPGAAVRAAMPDEDGPIGDVVVLVQPMEEYDRAA